MVTGASGFIGTAVCRGLRGRGHEVVAASLRAGASGFRIGDEATVVHLAGIAHRNASAVELKRVNVDYPLEIGRAAAASGAHMIFMSSIKVYGEESESPLAQDSPRRPRDPYGRSKAIAEEGLLAMPGLRLTIIRPPLVYGPGVKANFLALMKVVARAWPLPFESIRNRRSFLYVENLADLIRHCIEHASANEIHLPCDGSPLSTPQLCRELARALQTPARLFPFPPLLLELLPGGRRMTRSLYFGEQAWRPPFARDEALRETARWFRAR